MTAAGDAAAPEHPGYPDHSAALAEFVGVPAGAAQLSPDAVNLPMIRHWVEAMGDRDPAYLSDEAAIAAGHPGAFAPPAMLQAFIMRGLAATQQLEASRAAAAPPGDSAMERMSALLDDEGLTSVVATNCEQSYDRPLVAGDRLVTQATIESVSDIKHTGLGTGRFLTTRTDFWAVPESSLEPGESAESVMARGEHVASMLFRILKFRPRPAVAERPKRPRPAVTQDNAFFFEGARRHELLVQRCTACGTLRHPPLPACGACRSFEWDAVPASGRGELYSWVVVHYPQVPAFDYPLTIGLVELEEGTRLVADLDGVAHEDLRVGLALEVAFVDYDDELSLPVFRPAGAGAGRG